MSTAKLAKRFRAMPVWLILAIASALPPSASADNAWYVAPQAIYAKPDSRVSDQSNEAYGVGVGTRLSNRLRFELDIQTARPVAADGTQIIEQYAGQTGLYVDLLEDVALRPYAGFGIGAIRVESAGDVSTLPSAMLALGFSNALSKNWHVDTEVRGRYAHDDRGQYGTRDWFDTQALVKLRIHFGLASTSNAVLHVTPIAPDPAEATCTGSQGCGPTASDRDSDTVPDSRDRCPNTIPKVEVDDDGCMTGN